MSHPKRILYDLAVVAIGLALTRSACVDLDGPAIAVLVPAALALALRRTRPMAVGWLTAAAALALPVLGLDLRPPGEPLVLWPPGGAFAVYALLVHAGERRWRWLPVALIVLGAFVPVWVLDPTGRAVSDPGAVAFRSVSAVIIGLLLGLYVASRRRELDALRERAERAESERHLLAERARAEERSRLAAEMHDVVTHRVTLMVMQAGALRVTTREDGVRRVAEELRVTGCQALEELRDVIGLLRRDPDAAGPAATLALTSLMAPADVLREEGDPALLSPVVARTVHRIVQESLTNARKHAPGAPIEVTARYRQDGVALAVRNAAPAGPADPEIVATGSGSGLDGLRRRAELVGGTLTAAPDGSGFLVEAALPAYVEAP